MSHRSGNAFHKRPARDLGLLALGVVLVITGVALSTCSSVDDLFSSSPGVGARPPSAPGGEEE